jgi:adenylate cyclase
VNILINNIRFNTKKTKLKQIILAFAGFFSLAGDSQTAKVDSLKWMLKSEKSDTIKSILLGKICKEYYKRENIDSAIVYTNNAIAFSKVVKYSKGLVLPYLVLGNIVSDKGNYAGGIDYYNKSLEIAKATNDSADMAGAYNNIGINFYLWGNYAVASEYYLKALKIAEKLSNKEKMFHVYINMGVVSTETNFFDDALKYFLLSYQIALELKDTGYIATSYQNIGNTYVEMNNHSQALRSLDSSLFFVKIIKNKFISSRCYNDIGNIYCAECKYDSALNNYLKSLILKREIDEKQDEGVIYKNIGKVYISMKELLKAKNYLDSALYLSKTIGDKKNIKDVYASYVKLDSATGNYGAVLRHYKMYNTYRDSLTNEESTRKIESEKLSYEFEKQQQADSVEFVRKQAMERSEQETKAAHQRIVRNVFIGGFGFAFLFASVFFFQRKRISKERDKSDKLLLNILPAETAKELKATGESKARNYDLVTVMFTDFKNFTKQAENMSAEELVKEINFCYKEFDKINSRHNVEKIKTMGDGYMAAGGVPHENTSNPFDTVAAAIEIQNSMEFMKTEREKENRPYFEVRIGIHSGPVVAGIVGLNKFAYDIWGDTVNIAARMESSGEAWKVNISGATYELVKDKFNCTYRGKIQAKNKGEIDMYFVEG